VTEDDPVDEPGPDENDDRTDAEDLSEPDVAPYAIDAGDADDMPSESTFGGNHGGSPYVESQVIMSAVRVITPFAFTYGLFLTFHGGGSPGGGFQGGAIVGTTVLMIAFAFGIEPTRDWLANSVVVALASGGIVAYALIGFVPMLTGASFLEHGVFSSEFDLYHGKKYALEAVEILGVMPIVAAVVVGLFFAIATGLDGDDTWEPEPWSEPTDDAVESTNGSPGGDAE